ncbi:MAG TPA: GYF domain-containing protein [Myxococcales bacterium]|jgi:predicted Zn finger-like uncharacterized protein|nr:GYF domain-containing protein [Myxococcales bacterium]
MQFACESCKTQLQIADEKVRGKRLVVRCKRCGAKIAISDPLLTGSQAPRLVASAPPPSRPPSTTQPIQPVSRPAPARHDTDTESTRAMASDVLEKALQASKEPDGAGGTRDATSQNGVPQGEMAAPADDAIWFAMLHGKQTGPMTRTELEGRANAGDVGPRTYLWREGMESWQRARDLAELSSLFPPVPSAPPAVSQPPPPPPLATPASVAPVAAAPEASPAGERARSEDIAHGLFTPAENSGPQKSALDLARWATDELSRKKDTNPRQKRLKANAGTMFEGAAAPENRGPFAVFLVLTGLAAAAVALWIAFGPSGHKAEEPKVEAPPVQAATPPDKTEPVPPPKPVEPAAPPPKPAAAPPALSTGLTADQVRRKLDENKPALQGCVDEALRHDPHLRVGKIHIATTIAPSGQVTAARIDRRAVEEAPLGACLRKATRRIVFPQFSGQAFDVDIPIVVSAGE